MKELIRYKLIRDFQDHSRSCSDHSSTSSSLREIF